MKTKILIVFLMTAILFNYSCNKNTDAISSNGFAGSYRGIVSDSSNGVYTSMLNDYTIIINPTNTNGQVTLTNNLIIPSSGTIIGTTFTIPQTIVSQTSSSKTIQYAIGTFSGLNNNNWNVIFYQDLINLSTGVYLSRFKRSCSLIKQ
jgi:hypothetical protein